MFQHEAIEKDLDFFKTIRAYKNVIETFLRKEKMIRDHANAATLQKITQNDQKDDENDESDENKKKKNKKKNKNEDSSASSRKKNECLCHEVHRFADCSYIIKFKRKDE